MRIEVSSNELYPYMSFYSDTYTYFNEKNSYEIDHKVYAQYLRIAHEWDLMQDNLGKAYSTEGKSLLLVENI